MRTYLGVDGGGSKTAFVLIDDRGSVLAEHAEGPAYHFEVGLENLRAMLAHGIRATLELGRVAPSDLTFAFIGLPAYGEDSRLLPVLDSIVSGVLPTERYRSGNDMVCGWAGALAGADGINIVAGTGSIAYGEFRRRTARSGGWGELFGDEGSAYWIAREGLTLFSRMSDGRAARGVLYELVRQQFGLDGDLDLCAAIYGQDAALRSQFARLSKLIAQAADEGDAGALALFDRAAGELVDLVRAVRSTLAVPNEVVLPVSYSGGLFRSGNRILDPLRSALAADGAAYRVVEPRLGPGAGAALRAAMLSGSPLEPAAVTALTALKSRDSGPSD